MSLSPDLKNGLGQFQVSHEWMGDVFERHALSVRGYFEAMLGPGLSEPLTEYAFEQWGRNPNATQDNLDIALVECLQTAREVAFGIHSGNLSVEDMVAVLEPGADMDSLIGGDSLAVLDELAWMLREVLALRVYAGVSREVVPLVMDCSMDESDLRLSNALIVLGRFGVGNAKEQVKGVVAVAD